MSLAIREMACYRAVSPLSQPIADATHAIPQIAFIVTRLRLENGVVGESYLLAFHYSQNAIHGALKDIQLMAIGWSADRIDEFIAHYDRESEYFGNAGIHRWALGAVEIAMWDALARTRNKPVWRMLGGTPTAVPLYGSGGWLSYSIEQLKEEATAYVRRGFRAVKIKVGSPTVEVDIERLTKVRESVGPGVNIMMDANQGMNLESALDLSNQARNLCIGWFEEPLPNTDFEGYRRLKDEAGILLAMGEREFDLVALRELAGRCALDLWQPDILRLGGVKGWLDSASLARAHSIPVLPHYYKEYDVPLLMTVEKPYGAESFDWVDPLIDRPIRMENGFAHPHDEPGWGFRFYDAGLDELPL